MKGLVNLGDGPVEVEFGPDIDLDREVVYFEGERLTEARAEEVAREVSRRNGRKGGRPRKPAAERASVQKAVRITPETAERLKERSAEAGRTETSILREALNDWLDRSA